MAAVPDALTEHISKKQVTRPILDASVDWDAEYGALESHDGKHFIFLHSVIVNNYVLG